MSAKTLRVNEDSGGASFHQRQTARHWLRHEQAREGLWQRIGVDVHDWGSVDYIVEDSAKLPFDDASFDTVTIIAALNHIPNREDVLTECGRLLKTNGRIIVTMITPRISAMWHALRSPWDADQRERGMTEGEIFGFTSEQLVGTCAAGMDLHSSTRKRFMLWLNSVYVFEKK